MSTTHYSKSTHWHTGDTLVNGAFSKPAAPVTVVICLQQARSCDSCSYWRLFVGHPPLSSVQRIDIMNMTMSIELDIDTRWLSYISRRSDRRVEV